MPKPILLLMLLLTMPSSPCTNAEVVIEAQGELGKIITVNYCKLISKPERFKGRLVRVEASFLFGKHSNMLYDLACNGNSIDPVFNCYNKEECRAMLDRLFNRSRGYDLSYRRVRAIFIGKFYQVDNSSEKLQDKNDKDYKLDIQKVEKISSLSKATPWPWKENPRPAKKSR